MSQPFVRITNIDHDINQHLNSKLTNGICNQTKHSNKVDMTLEQNEKLTDSFNKDKDQGNNPTARPNLRKRRKVGYFENKIKESDDISSQDDEEIHDTTTHRTLRRKKSVETTNKFSNKRRKRKKIVYSSSEEEDAFSQSSDDDDNVKSKTRGSKQEKETKANKKKEGRKKIKKIIGEVDLLEQTKEAAKEEEERLKRLEEQAKSSQSVNEHKKDEIDIIEENTTNVILQNNPLVQVSPYIACQLRPHQVEGVRFIWDNLIESSIRASANPGGGCILAHCMGLGKTLQTIASVHTMLKSEHLPFKCALVVAPMNTVRNWIAEFVKWCEDGDELQLYNIAECRSKKGRIALLRTWHRKGGVMIIGYDMYRILTTKTKYKGWKETVYQCVVDPGPDLVVCDEGHMLKNANSHTSIALNKIKTRRRLVLTGTPLQNNLVEYHCMVDFVKPDLLGSLKEFRNRFVNPIINGQHTDSTNSDVNVMKKRSHVLHQMLRGFVQRKDYSALKPYLCPKYEYVLKVRLTPLQNSIYKHYLNTMTNRGTDTTVVDSSGKGSSLFRDYQNLMRVWTHPKSLLLHTVKREKMERLALKDFLTDEEADEYSTSETEEDGTISNEEWSASQNQKGKSKLNNQKKEVKRNGRTATDSSKKNVSKLTNRSGDASDDSIGGQRRRSRRILIVDDSSGDEKSYDSDSSAEDNRSEKESDVDEKLPDRSTRLKNRTMYRLRGDDENSGDDIEMQTETTPEWYASLLPEDQSTLDKCENSSKITLLFEILRLAAEKNEKVLVFSQSLISLDLIEEMLFMKSRNQNCDEEDLNDLSGLASTSSNGYQTWFKNIDYFRMDGSTLGYNRERWINAFNDEDDSRSRLFLISTRAGSLGVNLVGANRVVIFDASWNPTHDTQSMFRVYRFGQKKTCYIYRLIAEGTMEEKIYQRQVSKQSLSIRVVDEQQINRYFTASSLAEMYTFNPTTPEDDKDKPTPVVPKDNVLAELLLDPQTRYLIASYHEHDSLLDHQVNEELTEDERKAAWEEYELEKKRGSMPMITQRQIRPTTVPSTFFISNTPNLNMKDSFNLMTKVNKLMQDAYIRVRSHETKPIQDIVDQLKNTPLYANTSEATLEAIAKEVNFRLALKRDEAQLHFNALQEQYRILQSQYFQNVGTLMANGGLGNSSTFHQNTMPAIQIPSRDTLLQQMGSSQNNAIHQNEKDKLLQTTTKIEIIDVSDTEETGTSSKG